MSVLYKLMCDFVNFVKEQFALGLLKEMSNLCTAGSHQLVEGGVGEGSKGSEVKVPAKYLKATCSILTRGGKSSCGL